MIYSLAYFLVLRVMIYTVSYYDTTLTFLFINYRVTSEFSWFLVDEGSSCFLGMHKTLLACFSLIVGCVDVAWWLQAFRCMIFVRPF
jgi:hypothetical protein